MSFLSSFLSSSSTGTTQPLPPVNLTDTTQKMEGKASSRLTAIGQSPLANRCKCLGSLTDDPTSRGALIVIIVSIVAITTMALIIHFHSISTGFFIVSGVAAGLAALVFFTKMHQHHEHNKQINNAGAAPSEGDTSATTSSSPIKAKLKEKAVKAGEKVAEGTEKLIEKVGGKLPVPKALKFTDDKVYQASLVILVGLVVLIAAAALSIHYSIVSTIYFSTWGVAGVVSAVILFRQLSKEEEPKVKAE